MPSTNPPKTSHNNLLEGSGATTNFSIAEKRRLYNTQAKAVLNENPLGSIINAATSNGICNSMEVMLTGKPNQ